MKRILIGSLVMGLAASVHVMAATRNWLTAPELYCSPVPRTRHGKTAARKYRRRFHAHRH